MHVWETCPTTFCSSFSVRILHRLRRTWNSSRQWLQWHRDSWEMLQIFSILKICNSRVVQKKTDSSFNFKPSQFICWIGWKNTGHIYSSLQKHWLHSFTLLLRQPHTHGLKKKFICRDSQIHCLHFRCRYWYLRFGIGSWRSDTDASMDQTHCHDTKLECFSIPI